ncbi:MAG: Gfo/Idh/MocA family oxidoreductase [Deltaproteobacteria bacterium]|nr:Gfo/Idh/MocA family oxidoreductase [Candidatus Anaeroferrophillus wilburensis]MBN2889753.1 Gfo/Idh/MocA family oxidoreductase [Deltaproteobacteria bacterium]
MTDSEKIVKVGVVGVGHLGRYHVQKYAALPGAELVGISDLDQPRAAELAGQYHARVFADLDELCSQVDAVSVVVPTVDHCRVASRFLAAGVHVLLEKPIAATLAEARELVAMADSRRVVLQVGHLERFNPVFTAAAKKITAPRFLEVHRLSPFTFRSVDIDVILDLMIHDIDLVLSLVKSPIRDIYAVGVPVLSHQVDIANVRIHFANGAVCNLTASRVSVQRERKIRLFQQDTYFSLDLGNFSLIECAKKEFDYSAPIPAIDLHKEEFPDSDSLMLEIESFLHAVRHHEQPVVSGRDGLAALEVAFLVKEAIAGQTAGSWPG